MVPALIAGIRRAHAPGDQVARHAQAFVREVAVDSKAGLGTKQAHHIIFTEVKGVREGINADVLGQVRVEIFEYSSRLFVAVFRGGVA